MLIGHQCGTQAVVKESSPVGVGHVSQRELVHAVEEVSAVKQVDLRLEPVFLMAFAEHGEERMVEDRLRTLSLHSPAPSRVFRRVHNAADGVCGERDFPCGLPELHARLGGTRQDPGRHLRTRPRRAVHGLCLRRALFAKIASPRKRRREVRRGASTSCDRPRAMCAEGCLSPCGRC